MEQAPKQRLFSMSVCWCSLNVAADPSNAGWQRELAWSHQRMAQHGSEPLKHWREVVRILRALDADGRLSREHRAWLLTTEQNLAAGEKISD